MNDNAKREEEIRVKEVARLFALAAMELARKDGLLVPDNLDREGEHLTFPKKKIK